MEHNERDILLESLFRSTETKENLETENTLHHERRQLASHFKEELHKKLDASLLTLPFPNKAPTATVHGYGLGIHQEFLNSNQEEPENIGDFQRSIHEQRLGEQVRANQANRKKEIEDLKWISNYYIARQRRASEKPTRDLINSIKYGRYNVEKKKDPNECCPVPLGKNQALRIAEWRKGGRKQDISSQRKDAIVLTTSEDETPSDQHLYPKRRTNMESKQKLNLKLKMNSSVTKTKHKYITPDVFGMRKKEIVPAHEAKKIIPWRSSDESVSDDEDTESVSSAASRPEPMAHQRHTKVKNKKSQEEIPTKSMLDQYAEDHEQKMLERYENNLMVYKQHQSAKELFKRKGPFQASSLVVVEDSMVDQTVPKNTHQKRYKQEASGKKPQYEHPAALSTRLPDAQSKQVISKKQGQPFLSTVSSMFGKIRKALTGGRKDLQKIMEELEGAPDQEAEIQQRVYNATHEIVNETSGIAQNTEATDHLKHQLHRHKQANPQLTELPASRKHDEAKYHSKIQDSTLKEELSKTTEHFESRKIHKHADSQSLEFPTAALRYDNSYHSKIQASALKTRLSETPKTHSKPHHRHKAKHVNPKPVKHPKTQRHGKQNNRPENQATNDQVTETTKYSDHRIQHNHPDQQFAEFPTGKKHINDDYHSKAQAPATVHRVNDASESELVSPMKQQQLLIKVKAPVVASTKKRLDNDPQSEEFPAVYGHYWEDKHYSKIQTTAPNDQFNEKSDHLKHGQQQYQQIVQKLTTKKQKHYDENNDSKIQASVHKAQLSEAIDKHSKHRQKRDTTDSNFADTHATQRFGEDNHAKYENSSKKAQFNEPTEPLHPDQQSPYSRQAQKYYDGNYQSMESFPSNDHIKQYGQKQSPVVKMKVNRAKKTGQIANENELTDAEHEKVNNSSSKQVISEAHHKKHGVPTLGKEPHKILEWVEEQKHRTVAGDEFFSIVQIYDSSKKASKIRSPEPTLHSEHHRKS